MIADWINEELLKTKASLEAKKNAQIQAQQQKAQNDYIVPRNKALEEDRDAALLKEKQEYDAKVAELQKVYGEKIKLINDSCELQKQAYKDQVFATINAEIAKEYESTIKLLDSQINK